MALSFCVLGSGSLGNSTLVVLPAPRDRFVLIDCGLSPRATASRLAPLGIKVDDISALLLTHLDTDHYHRGWNKPVRQNDLPVHVHRRHRNLAVQRGLDGRHLQLFDAAFDLDDAHVDPILLAHDALGTVGYMIERAGVRFGYATDLGRVTSALSERFVNLHALAIESNYDAALQRTSGRPAYLKRRITGGAGHLSNEQSVDAVLHVDARSRLAHVVPLHLSRQCNDPLLVKHLYTARAPHLLDRLTISSQYRPTAMLRVEHGPHVAAGPGARMGEQLVMF